MGFLEGKAGGLGLSCVRGKKGDEEGGVGGPASNVACNKI